MIFAKSVQQASMVKGNLCCQNFSTSYDIHEQLNLKQVPPFPIIPIRNMCFKLDCGVCSKPTLQVAHNGID